MAESSVVPGVLVGGREARDPGGTNDAGFLVYHPHLRNVVALAMRRSDGDGSSTIARVWIDQ